MCCCIGVFSSLLGDCCFLPAASPNGFVQKMVPRGLEPRTLRLLAVRSNQLSYETSWQQISKSGSLWHSNSWCFLCDPHWPRFAAGQKRDPIHQQHQAGEETAAAQWISMSPLQRWAGTWCHVIAELPAGTRKGQPSSSSLRVCESQCTCQAAGCLKVPQPRCAFADFGLECQMHK